MRSAANLDIRQKAKLTNSPSNPTPEFVTLQNKRPSTLHPRGTVLFTEGQPSLGVYSVRSGSVKVSIGSAQGRVLILRIAKVGDLLGVNSVLSGLPYEATAETLEASRIDFFPRDEFVAMKVMDSRVNDFLFRSVSREASEMVEAARMLLLSETATEKLARLLLKWCEKDGVNKPHGIAVNNNFTHEDVGQMIGTSRETVTRLLGAFKKSQIIGLTSNTVLVRNVDLLESIANRT